MPVDLDLSWQQVLRALPSVQHARDFGSTIDLQQQHADEGGTKVAKIASSAMVCDVGISDGRYMTRCNYHAIE